MQYYIDPFLSENSFEDEIFVCISFFDVPPNVYYISNYGRVYSSISRKFLKPQISTYGYYYVALGSSSRHFIHRLVAMAFVPGYSEERNCVNHKNGDKLYNYYLNLEWCTKAENNTHAYATHLNNYIGENCRSAKLTNEQVHQIYQLLQDGVEIYPILDIMGMEPTMNNYEIIRSIRKGYAWKSISKYYNVGYTSHHIRSIPDEEIDAMCQCFEKGMNIIETYEYAYKQPFPGRNLCDKYNIMNNVYKKLTHKKISSKYNF